MQIHKKRKKKKKFTLYIYIFEEYLMQRRCRCYYGGNAEFSDFEIADSEKGNREKSLIKTPWRQRFDVK